MKKKNLIKNSIILIFGTTLPKIMLFITLPLYTFFLSKQEYGTYDIIMTLSTLIIPLATLQLHSSIFRYLIDTKKLSEQKKIISTALMTIFFITLTLLLVAFCIPVVYNYETKFNIYLYFAVNVIFQVFLEISRGLGKKKQYTLASIINACFIVVLSTLFMHNLNNKILAAFASINLAGIITIVYLLIVTKIWKYISLKYVNKKLLKEMLVYSIPLIPNSLSWWIINVSDRFIIKLMLGVEANAIYAVANKIPSIYSLFYNGFNLAWQESASLDSKNDKMYYQNIFASLSKFLMGGLLILISILPIIFKLLVIGDYNESYYQMPILCISLLFSSLSAFLGGIYIATKNSKKLGISSFLASLMNVIINFLLIKKIGLYAASFSTLVSFFILTLYRYYDIKKLCYLKINIKLLIIFILSLSIIVFGYYNKNMYFLLTNILLSNSIFVILNKEIMQSMIHKVKL